MQEFLLPRQIVVSVAHHRRLLAPLDSLQVVDRTLENLPLDTPSGERLVDDRRDDVGSSGSAFDIWRRDGGGCGEEGVGVKGEFTLAGAGELDDVGRGAEGEANVVNDGPDVGARRDRHRDFEHGGSGGCEMDK